MEYFQTNASTGLITFHNTGDLAKQIKFIMQSLGKMADIVDKDLGKKVKNKTRFSIFVPAAVRLALRNNGFNYHKREFCYQGRKISMTRAMNKIINGRIRRAAPKQSELIEAAITMLIASLLTKSRLSPVAVDVASHALSCAVIVAITKNGGDIPVSRDDIKSTAVGTTRKAMSSDQVQSILNHLTPADSKYITIDKEKSLIQFENTKDLAGNINQLIERLRHASGGVPVIGSDLSVYMKKKTPGKRNVNQGVKAVLKNNAFNYKKMQFESQGFALGTTKAVNHLWYTSRFQLLSIAAIWENYRMVSLKTCLFMIWPNSLLMFQLMWQQAHKALATPVRLTEPAQNTGK